MNKKLKTIVIVLSCVVVFYAVVGGLIGKETGQEGAYKQLQVFSEVLLRIKSDYVEDPNMKLVSEGALRGVLESLDPYSSYLTPEEVAQMNGPSSKDRGDIGLEISKRFGYINVVTTVPGSPSDRAGLITGDIIEAINDVSTRDVSVQQAKMFFRGPVGATVTLSILRGQRTEPIKVDVVREVIPVLAVSYKMADASVGYIRLSELAPGKADEVKKAIEQLQKQGAKQWILDVRDLATNDLDEAVAVANLFLDHGTIVSVEGQKYPKKSYTADKSKFATGLPLAVLINRGSASDAEVIASAILENNRGDVVGERSYGIGSVQKTIPLDDGSVIILSMGKYYSPAGHLIQNDKDPSKSGVDPTIPVKIDYDALMAANEGAEQVPEAEKAQSRATLPPKPKNQPDAILDKALEVLHDEAAKTKKAA
ncbi:MAG: S41 family peptidase [Acidobacteriia bacterium]|nr:S41 family peptidase [Terriglobia bacterium]